MALAKVVVSLDRLSSQRRRPLSDHGLEHGQRHRDHQQNGEKGRHCAVLRRPELAAYDDVEEVVRRVEQPEREQEQPCLTGEGEDAIRRERADALAGTYSCATH